jgi:nitrite reductase (cytochrome c-552)
MSQDEDSKTKEPPRGDAERGSDDGKRPRKLGYVIAVVVTALVTVAVVALLTNIFERKHEGRTTYERVVDVDESTTDPAVWGKNWPSQYQTYKQTVDYGAPDTAAATPFRARSSTCIPGFP